MLYFQCGVETINKAYLLLARDGTLVLTVTNNCGAAGYGSDVIQFAAASDTKNGNAASRSSPAGKPSVITVGDDVTRFSGTAADDVNVWPRDRQAGTLWDRKYNDDDDYTRVRRGASDSVRHVCTNEYMSKNPRVASSVSSQSAACRFPDNG